MSDPVRKALNNVCSGISQETTIYLNSKKINLLERTVLLIRSAMRNQDLTDIAMVME